MQPYIPNLLPLADSALDFRALFSLVAKANAALARYDGLLVSISNPIVLLSPLTNTEAVLSSKIEGTQATVDEVLEQEAGLIKEGSKFEDIQEIINYRKALFEAKEYLKDYPIRLSFVRELHRILMDSVRGKDKTPGEFRKDQNWIGKYGCSIENATFIPPNPLQLPNYLQAWEQYLDSDDIDFLLQTAVMHAQFELLHPFKDGNGRIGRILIPLFLYQKKALSQPMFYLSEYLEAHRETYYQRLQAISVEGDWNGWIAFFLQAIITQAEHNSARVKAIQNLYENMKSKIHHIISSKYAINALDVIFRQPIFDTSYFTSYFIKEFDLTRKTSSNFLSKLREANILQELRPSSGRQPAILCFVDLLNLTEGKEI